MIALFGWNNLQQPVMAHIVEASATPSSEGFVEVRIVFPSRLNEGSEYRRVQIPEAQLVDATIPIWWADGDGEEILLEDPRLDLAGHYAFAGGLGFLLGLVVLGSLRGYGYVRGDGEPGSKPEVPVGEERGFYWRT